MSDKQPDPCERVSYLSQGREQRLTISDLACDLHAFDFHDGHHERDPRCDSASLRPRDALDDPHLPFYLCSQAGTCLGVSGQCIWACSDCRRYDGYILDSACRLTTTGGCRSRIHNICDVLLLSAFARSS